ncbi:MAG: spore germination protein, partial [Bacillus sp. (in: firmicutes)]|nr:spore germination protein [Bacillus sp. (in: firmicutes)]
MGKRVTSVILIMLLLSGCVKKEILDDISIESGLGFDHYKGQQILGTAMVPRYMADKSVKNVTFTSISTMNRELFLEMQRQSPDPLVIGSLEIVMFGEKLAQNGIIDLIDALQRDATIGERLYLVVVDGKAIDLLKQDYGSRGNATYFSNLIKQNMETRDLPTTNLHMFIYDFFQTGKDPFLPRIKKIGSNKMEVNGISLFKKDKIVDVITPNKMFFFKLLADKYSQGTYKIKVDGNQAAVRSIKSNHKFVMSKKGPLEITIHIKIKGAIREYSGNKLSHKETIMIEKKLEKVVNQECLKLINHFKDIGIDP